MVQRAARYRGTDTDYQQIANLFRSFTWTPGTIRIYITNGWHTGFEGRPNASGQQVMMEVTYCDYQINDETAAIQHYYLN